LQQDYHPIFLADFAPISYPATFTSLPPAAWVNLYQAVTSPIVPGSADQQARAAALQPYADVPLTVSNWAGGNLLNEVVVPYLKRAGKNLTRESLLAALYKGPVISETYGTINITGPNINPVVVTGLHVATFDPSHAETITSERYTPEVTPG
jgi:hypothetical protein